MLVPWAAEQLCIVTQVCLLLIPVYLFMGLMMMYLLLRTLHKMADLHGLTTFLQLPRCEESDRDEDREPIVENEQEAALPCPVEKTSSKPLDPGSQSSYNTIDKDWGKRRQNEQYRLPLRPFSQKHQLTLRLERWTGYTSLLFLIWSFLHITFTTSGFCWSVTDHKVGKTKKRVGASFIVFHWSFCNGVEVLGRHVWLADMFAGAVNPRIATCGLPAATKRKLNFFTWVHWCEGARPCVWVHSFTLVVWAHSSLLNLLAVLYTSSLSLESVCSTLGNLSFVFCDVTSL